MGIWESLTDEVGIWKSLTDEVRIEPRSRAPEADALTTWPTRRYNIRESLQTGEDCDGGLMDLMMELFVGCLTSKQRVSVSQGRVCSDNFTCCHTETEVADPKKNRGASGIRTRDLPLSSLATRPTRRSDDGNGRTELLTGALMKIVMAGGRTELLTGAHQKSYQLAASASLPSTPLLSVLNGQLRRR